MIQQNLNTIHDLRRLCRMQGNYWFDESSMRFFDTRIETELLDKKYFITSEQPPAGGRRYSIRKVYFDGFHVEIDTIGEFAVMSRATAFRKLKELRA